MPLRCAFCCRDCKGIEQMSYNQETKQKQGKPREWREAAKQKRNPAY